MVFIFDVSFKQIQTLISFEYTRQILIIMCNIIPKESTSNDYTYMAHTNDFYNMSEASTPGLQEWNCAVFRTNEMKGATIIQMQSLSNGFKMTTSNTFYVKGKHLNANLHRRQNSA